MIPSVQCTGPGEESMAGLACSMLRLFPLSIHLTLTAITNMPLMELVPAAAASLVTLAFKPAEGTALGEISSILGHRVSL
jgi:hypothetical protein